MIDANFIGSKEGKVPLTPFFRYPNLDVQRANHVPAENFLMKKDSFSNFRMSFHWIKTASYQRYRNDKEKGVKIDGLRFF